MKQIILGLLALITLCVFTLTLLPEVSAYIYIYDDYTTSGFDPNLIDYFQRDSGEGYAALHSYRTGNYYGRKVLQKPNGEVLLGNTRTITRSGTKYTVFIEDPEAPKITHNLDDHERFNIRANTLTFASYRGYGRINSEKRYYAPNSRYYDPYYQYFD